MLSVLLLKPGSDGIRGQIRVKFHFCQINSQKMPTHVFLIESYDF